MSERNLDSELQSSAESSAFNYVVFVDLSFPTGNVRVHNSVGTISFGGNDYLGVGAFGNISAMEETIDLVDNPIQIGLSSITPEIIAAVKTDDIYGRDADIYIGALDQEGELQGTPTNWVSGYMEHSSVLIGEDNSVMIQIQTRAAKLKQRNNKRWTLEEHQVENPGDVFLEFLASLQDSVSVNWGGKEVATGIRYGGSRLDGRERLHRLR